MVSPEAGTAVAVGAPVADAAGEGGGGEGAATVAGAAGAGGAGGLGGRHTSLHHNGAAWPPGLAT